MPPFPRGGAASLPAAAAGRHGLEREKTFEASFSEEASSEAQSVCRAAELWELRFHVHFL